eukprot:1375798-Rhodomonas_salina.1
MAGPHATMCSTRVVERRGCYSSFVIFFWGGVDFQFSDGGAAVAGDTPRGMNRNPPKPQTVNPEA